MVQSIVTQKISNISTLLLKKQVLILFLLFFLVMLDLIYVVLLVFDCSGYQISFSFTQRCIISLNYSVLSLLICFLTLKNLKYASYFIFLLSFTSKTCAPRSCYFKKLWLLHSCFPLLSYIFNFIEFV